MKIRTELTKFLLNNKNALQKKVRKLVLDIYYNYFDIFNKAESDKLLKLKEAGNYSIYLQNNKG